MTQTVSIAMATYNGARWLRQQLDSFVDQRRRPDELVITDDGSTDETPAVVDDFARRAPFAVRFVRNEERLGFNGNFARAIALTSGDVIFISDQDDVWYPDKIARVAGEMVETSCLCVVNDQAIADADGRETGGTVLHNVRALGRPDSWYGPGCCTAFARTLLPVLLPMPGDTVQYDHWINTLADSMGVRRVIDEPLQMYRRHDANATGSVFARHRPGWRSLVMAARRNDAKSAIGAKVTEIDALLERLTMPAVASLAQSHLVSRGVSQLVDERHDYAARAGALERDRLRRVPAVLHLLAKGRYRRFSGVVTAAKDLLS